MINDERKIFNGPDRLLSGVFSGNIPVECRKTAALIVFRFAIPDEELDHICKLLIETELGELESAVYQAYRFYISEPF